ncbi:MAG: hypothetical protein JXX29_07830 [Deltaproteobacteria bacterium]|nr:hypothetical protein [Deltaproteobacteria bacterium]MBN2671567.1 hypothetical protein [Deltaproteobacteria bacterium]
MVSKDSTAQDFFGQLKKLPFTPNDLAVLAFNFRHRKEPLTAQPVQSRRAQAVSAFRQKKEEIKIDLGVLSHECDHNFYRGFSDDVEDGGIFVATFDTKPIGTAMTIRFELPDKTKVTAKGVVQYTREHSTFLNDDNISGMGISFCYLENTDKSAIEAYQEERHPIFFDL